MTKGTLNTSCSHLSDTWEKGDVSFFLRKTSSLYPKAQFLLTMCQNFRVYKMSWSHHAVNLVTGESSRHVLASSALHVGSGLAVLYTASPWQVSYSHLADVESTVWRSNCPTVTGEKKMRNRPGWPLHHPCSSKVTPGTNQANRGHKGANSLTLWLFSRCELVCLVSSRHGLRQTFPTR